MLDATGAFYFLEMNTRLQVEHPVTEEILGIDLVEWQLRVAAGEPLPLAQSALVRRAHAIEARIYAEDPRNRYLPATGRLELLRWPEGVRVDTGVRAGDEVGVHYDPLLAKLIVVAADRSHAVGTFAAALAGVQLAGVTTNLELLGAIARHPAFIAGSFDTGFLDRHHQELLPTTMPAARIVLVAALEQLLTEREQARALVPADQPWSPWASAGCWRVGPTPRRRLEFTYAATALHIDVTPVAGGWQLELENEPAVSGQIERVADGSLLVQLDAQVLPARVDRSGTQRWVVLAGERWLLSWHDLELDEAQASDRGEGQLSAPLPARVVAVTVAVGDIVRAGQVLVILEAMKMEQTIVAPHPGRVAELRCAAGDQVAEGTLLVVLEDPS
jgi:3-methylcrotonyl-CoA carboxylase alpha subunit